MTDNVIEPGPIDDVFCTEVVKVERLGPCLRLWFAVPQQDTFGGADSRVIVAKLVIPAEEATAIARSILTGPQQETKPTHTPILHEVN